MSKEEMIEEIKKMTVVELADLVKAIEEPQHQQQLEQ